METRVDPLPDQQTSVPPPALLGGAAILALLSASCCVLPIGLSLIGLGGAWLTILGPFVAYRLYILAGLALLLGWSWFSLLRPGSCRARRRKAVRYTAIATLAFALAASAPLWQGTAEAAMWNLWRLTR
jgi:mercuric ion transport protein